MKFLLDSVIVIDHLNGIHAASDFLAQNFDKAAVSVITRAKVLAGCSPSSLNIVKSLLNQFQTLSMMERDADKAAEIRAKFKIKLPDAIQAAMAMNHKLQFVTRNTKDFTKRRFDNIIVPYHV